jgi:hypothetical protein
MTDTVNLKLPYIEASQAQKHVTHNDALSILDRTVHLSILASTHTSPPASPSEGDRHIVATGATGEWSGRDQSVAVYADGGWLFDAPKAGWRAWSIAEAALLVFNGTAWSSYGAPPQSLDNLLHLGVGTTADATNPFSAKLNNALWTARTVAEGGDGNLRYKLSKQAAANTLSFLFQDNYSARAEIGLCGDDDFHFKVSPDGSTWFEGLRIDRTNGRVSFPGMGGPRETLSAARTYYVRTDGSDANNGLTNTSGGAFLTIQKAIDIISTLDIRTYNVTIQVADGTYAGTIVCNGPWLGSGLVVLQGNTATPANCVISTTAQILTVKNGASLIIKGFKLTATAGHLMECLYGGSLEYSYMDFGSASTASHVRCSEGGKIKATGPYTISGSAGQHWSAVGSGASIRCQFQTITITGTPAFAWQFANGQLQGLLIVNGNTYSGSATGSRYNAADGGEVSTAGAGATALPGNAAGTGTTPNVAPYGLYN